MNTVAAERALNILLSTIKDMGPNVDQTAVNEIAAEIYEGLVGPYRPILRMAPGIADAIGKDASTVAAAIVNLMNSIADNPEVRAAMATRVAQRAKARRTNFIAYTKAGFTRSQAMDLVLLDAVNANGQVHSVMGKVPRSSAR